MHFFDKKSSFWLCLGCLFLLFLPKINLISLGARETAGIRIDDLVLLGFCLIIFVAHFALKLTMCPLERSIIALLFFSLFSFFSNKILVAMELLNVHASILYCLRMFEYFLFFYVGILSASFFGLSRVMKAFFGWNLLLMVLQKAGIIGQFSVVGYITNATDRVSGIASFPSEAGMLINMAFCYLIFEDEKNPRWQKILPANLRAFYNETYVYWMFLISSTLVIITGSRIAIVGLVIPFIVRIYRELRKGGVGSWFLASLFLGAAALLTTVMIQKTASISKRSAGLLSFKNLELIKVVWNNINLDYDPIGHESVAYGSQYDMSWWMRIHKWCYALKIYYLHPECYLQGVGPGFAMAALDGGYIRILCEYGLIGCCLFWRVFSTIYRQSTPIAWMVISFMINMIFFDVYLAYKPMSLLLFASGATFAYQRHQNLSLQPV
jgi:hypothetical protein